MRRLGGRACGAVHCSEKSGFTQEVGRNKKADVSQTREKNTTGHIGGNRNMGLLVANLSKLSYSEKREPG